VKFHFVYRFYHTCPSSFSHTTTKRW